jgi:UDP-N-acetylglucosamine transferase subunit ALG13
MVSKSKKLGQPTLIFISIGSTKFSFTRLFTSVDKILNGEKLSSSLLIQQGSDNYVWKYPNVKKIKYLLPKQLINQIKRADKLIIHGGPATIYLVVKYARFMPLIIPRLAKYKEHVDNHQLFFIKYLWKKLPDNLKKYFVFEEKIDDIIGNYLKEKNINNSLNDFLFLDKNKDEFVNNLDKYINIL